jgi:O-methyltransferase
VSSTTTAQLSIEGLYERHLALLERCLTGSIYPEEFTKIQFRRGSWQRAVFGPIKHLLNLKGYMLCRLSCPTPEEREGGLHWPGQGQTMIGLKRLRNVRSSLEIALADNIPGDVVETGVWRGGCCIYMKSILECHGSVKSLWVCDSFQGVPKPNSEKYPADAVEERKEAFYKFDQLAVSVEEVRESFRRYGVLDERVHFLKGWFSETLPTAPIERISLMRLDGDLYESTWDALTHLYPKLSPGGFCLIDDYGGIPACAQAVGDYRKQNDIREPIVAVDTSGVYWRKSH